MRLDTASVLRILAHELRSPASVAQGCIKMALEGRLSDPADHRRALQQTHDATERMTELGREASELASWLERSAAFRWRALNVRALLDSALHRFGESRIDVSLASVDASLTIRTCDETALATALASLIAAVTREAAGARLTLSVGAPNPPNGRVDLALGPAHLIPDLFRGPSAPGATPLPLERGGLGLSLIIAVLVLDAHDAPVWTTNGHRAGLGISLPVETGQGS